MSVFLEVSFRFYVKNLTGIRKIPFKIKAIKNGNKVKNFLHLAFTTHILSNMKFKTQFLRDITQISAFKYTFNGLLKFQ